MTLSDHSPVEIRPVAGRGDLTRFIRVPWYLYRSDPNWVPPLMFERRRHLSPKNPCFKHIRWRAWTAFRDRLPVGRISAQVDELYLQRYPDRTGFFGMLEGVDDPAVFRALFRVAEHWLQREGMQRSLGPFNLSINQECGLLVEGFDTPPSVMMGHALPYYQDRVEEQGYQPVKDLLAYHLRPDFKAPRVMAALLSKHRDRIRVRPLRKSNLSQELEILRDIFNDAWSENWGFIPFTREEFRVMGKDLSLLVSEGMIQIAELDDDPVAFLAALPNLNEVIRDLNGRLLPFGWARLLWRLRVRFPRTMRVPLMGVRKKLQRSRLGPLLAFLVIDRARQEVIPLGVKDVEMSWLLEDNTGMRTILETLGGVVYKRYRMYEKLLGGSGEAAA